MLDTIPDPRQSNANGSLRLDGRRALVTGASGFLGAPLCRRLTAAGAEVHAVSRRTGIPDTERMRWWQADVGDAHMVKTLLSEVKPDVVIHMGGAVNGAPLLELALPTFHSLVTSTVTLLTLGTEMGCPRLVVVGSPEEPRGVLSGAIPASPYGAAKLATRVYARMFQKLFSTPVVIVTPYMTYGPGQAAWKVIPYTILSFLRGEPPRLSSGHRRLDWVYLDDVVDGFLRAVALPGMEGTAVDLGSGTALSIREVVGKIAAILGVGLSPAFGAQPDRSAPDGVVADISGAYARLGWRPMTSLDEGLVRTVEWYRRHGRQIGA